MVNWLRAQGWYWSLYYRHGIQWRWLPEPEARRWNVMILEGMEPPDPLPGYKQRIVRIPKHVEQLFSGSHS